MVGEGEVDNVHKGRTGPVICLYNDLSEGVRIASMLIRFGWDGYTQEAMLLLKFCRLTAPLHNFHAQVFCWFPARSWVFSI